MYWLDGPPVEAMLDTSGIGDSLPLTSLALDTALLQWGLFDSALSKIGLYFDTFIYPNGETPSPSAPPAWQVPILFRVSGAGTIDMGHCKIVILSRFACCPSR